MPGQRRRQRHAHDFYRTPPEITRQFLAVWARGKSPATILEPAAGDGAMLEPLREHWPQAELSAWDITPQHPDVKPLAFFLSADTKHDLIITNPPYKHALEFAERGLEMLTPGGYLVLLLRLNFLASKRRAAFFRQHLPTDVYVLSRRPSFLQQTGENPREWATDFSDYGWFVWREGSKHRTFRGRVL